MYMDVALIGDYLELNKKGIRNKAYHRYFTHYIIVWLQDFVKHPRTSKTRVGSHNNIFLKMSLKLRLNHMRMII